MTNGYRFFAWLTGVAVAVIAMIVVQWVFRDYDPLIVLPISQSFAFWLAWTIEWPLWVRHLPNRRVGFWTYTLSIAALMTVIAFTRYALKLG